MAGISPTPLRRLSNLARALGFGALLVKDESNRAGLPAFKVLGVAYAVNGLIETGALTRGAVVACASSGNHGRAVAKVARAHGLRAVVYLPAETIRSRVEAIRSEGATVIVTAGLYEDAVRQLVADAAREDWTVISDTSWPGYDELPRWIMAGYTRLLAEAERQWAPDERPDVVLVPAGVGGLAAALASWLRWRYGPDRPFLIASVPAAAPCLVESMRAGRAQYVHARPTLMAGLRCQELSHLAWPVLSASLDAAIAVEDRRATEAAHCLAYPVGGDPRVLAGPSGACALGALLTLLQEHDCAPVAKAARLGPETRVLVIVTEGMTDPVFREEVV